MRPVADLIDATDSAWPDLQAMVAAAPCPVEVLPPEQSRASECLHGLQVTTRSWLGALAYHTGGVVVDHGWLRVLGSGHEERRIQGVTAISAPEIAATGVVVAEDVLGGRFAWLQVESGRPPSIHYFAPDSLTWEDLEQGYGDWLSAMLGGATEQFYEDLRWPGWQNEVAACPLDRGIHTYPPLWSAEGQDLGAVSRQCVPMAELVAHHEDAARQMN